MLFDTVQTLIDEDRYRDAISLLRSILDNNPDNMDVYLALIYCYGILQAEFALDEEESKRILNESSELFNKAYSLFKDNADFLHYAGFMIDLGEWWYGQELDFGQKMFYEAYLKCPDNILYQSALYQNADDNDGLERYHERLVNYIEEKGSSFITDHGPLGVYYYRCCIEPYEKPHLK